MLKEELSKVLPEKKNLDTKLQSLTEKFELEKQKKSEFANELDRVKERAEKSDLLQTDYLTCKNEIVMLERSNRKIEEKLLLIYIRSECKMNCKEWFEDRNVEEVLRSINFLISQKDEVENWDVRKGSVVVN